MNIETTGALIPVQTALNPVKTIEYKGVDRFQHHNQHRNGIIFMGYGQNDKAGNYGPYGKEIKKYALAGKIVDIWV